MLQGNLISAAGGFLQQVRMDTIANNLANVNTVGYKRDVPVFNVRKTATQELGGKAMIHPRPFTIDWLSEKVGNANELYEIKTIQEQGALQQTGNPFDLAITGQGFFSVKDANGNQFYTRAGNFTLDKDGSLIMSKATSEGINKYKVVDENGSEITIPKNATPDSVTIGDDGIISYQVNAGDGLENVVLENKIGIFILKDNDPNNHYQKIGQNLYKAFGSNSVEVASASDFGIKQGYLEKSTANPIKEMVEMIDSSRIFEANMSFLRQQDQLLGRLLNEVGRSPA